jgi:hypothetical protein
VLHLPAQIVFMLGQTAQRNEQHAAEVMVRFPGTSARVAGKSWRQLRDAVKA